MNTHNTLNRSHSGILALLAALLFLAVLALPVAAFQLNGQDVTADAVGSTVEYPIILDEAPNGLAGYSITAQLSDGSVGEITAVSFPSWAGVNQHGTLPADSVLVRAADLNKNIQPGATGVLFATLTLRADAAGTTPVTITINQIDDDNYNLANPAVRSGSFTVPGSVTPTPTETIEPTPTTTQTPAPVADFSAAPLSGDAPLSVQFTDLSTGEGISAWAWDFENDGSIDSTEQNPLHTYTSAGTRSVKLMVTGTGGSDEELKAGLITVSDAPVPTPTTTQPPSHTVPAVTASAVGNTVVMNWEKISDADLLGYKVVVSKNNANPVYPADGYMYWITDRDTTSVTISAGDGYNGGDFGGSIGAGETYYFSITALYEPYESVAGNAVLLTMPGGVVPTPTQEPAPVAAFSVSPVSGYAPLAVQFTDASSGTVTSYAWDFTNDGVTDSTEKNPSYSYTTPGTYSVRLTVTGPGGSDDEMMTNAVTVTQKPAEKPVADFSGTPTSGYAPLTVQFTDNSSGDILAYYWDFNNDLVLDSSEKNPSHTFTQPGTYTVNMGVSGPGGLAYKIRHNYITVMAEPVPAPVAQFSAEPTSGDAPLTVKFTDASSGSISGYAWDFDNDGVIDSTEQSPLHIYPLAGSYAVNLTVTGPGGSDAEVKPALITVSEPLAKPVANFTADPLQGTVPLEVQFTDASTGSIVSWAWDFENDGSIDNVEQSPRHVFTAPGVYTVSLKVTNAAGSDTITRAALITVMEKAPVAQFSAEPLAGTVPLKVNFTDASSDAASYFWDFENDGVIDSTEKNPEHVYTLAGTYTVNLTVANGAGSASEIKAGYITAISAAPIANFTANVTDGKSPLAVRFTDLSIGDGISAWAWDFESDGTIDSAEQNPEFVFAQAGAYNVTLTVTGASGSDAMTREQYITVTMNEPVAEFSANQTSGYAPLTIGFTDASAGSVESWAWDFQDDGVVDSMEQNPVFTYLSAGNYTVNLTVANAGGSNRSVRADYISVRNVPAPVVDFSANLTAGYAPLTVQFTDESKGTGLISWSWDFNNDGIVDSTAQNPVYTFATKGNYTVSLAVKGTGGTTTAKKNDYIAVSGTAPAKPKAEFSAKPTSGKAPLTVQFTDKSVGKEITAWAWDFNGDGVTDSAEKNPRFTYTTKGSYNVSLTVTNAGGSDTRAKKNFIKVSQLEKPEADFKADKQSGKAPLTVKFTDKSKGDAITEWSWDFNNDGIIDSTQKNPTFTYASAGTYAVKLVVTNAAGSDMEVKSDFITVKGNGGTTPSEKKPIAVIFADKTWGTPPMTVKFADQSLNNPGSRTWFFGDGTSSTEKNPTHLYSGPGIYLARLYVENGSGTDQDFRFIFVLPKWFGMFYQ